MLLNASGVVIKMFGGDEMNYIKGMDRSQITLPQCLEDMISQDNPVRVIDAFVDLLDMTKLGFEKAQPASTGRPAYDPRCLLKLFLYGYFYAIRSSRRLMRECGRNVELFFLLNGLKPDFRTIADFRKNNTQAIRNVFRQFTHLCVDLKCYDPLELIAIDGSKFRAVNGNKRMYNQQILAKKLQRIEEKIEQYLKQMEQSDAQDEAAESQIQPQQPTLSQKIAILKERKIRYEAWQKELSQSGETQKLTTDPEARMMHTTKDGYHCCYNVQTAVSAESKLIVDYEVTNHVNDQGILHEFSQTVKETVGVETLQVVADKGYDCAEEILSCVMDGTIASVGFKDDISERLYPIEFIPSVVSEKQRHSTKPEDIRRCLHAGILPACYEGTNIDLEVHSLGNIGAFLRGDDKSFVTCPMGQRLNRTRERNGGTEYACKPACRQCSNRCKATNRHKVVQFGPETKCVAVRMYGNQPAVQVPPPNFIPTNSFFKKHPIEKTVLLRIADDPGKQRERLCISEHPFGTVKWHHGAHFVLCKGIKKTTAELGLSFLAYNLRRVINMMGVRALITAMRGV